MQIVQHTCPQQTRKDATGGWVHYPGGCTYTAADTWNTLSAHFEWWDQGWGNEDRGDVKLVRERAGGESEDIFEAKYVPRGNHEVTVGPLMLSSHDSAGRTGLSGGIILNIFDPLSDDL